MKAVVHKGKSKVAVKEVSDPDIEAPGDAIIRIPNAVICGQISERVNPTGISRRRLF